MRRRKTRFDSATSTAGWGVARSGFRTEYGRRRGSDFLAAPLAEFYSISFGPVPTANTTNMATWFRNVDQFRRFDVADRNQNIFNARFNYGIGPALDASVGLQVRDVEYPASEYGRNDHHKLTSPSVEVNWQPSPTTSVYAFYSFQDGGQHQAGLQPNACVMGNFYYFFSDGTVQTNATGVPPTPPVGTTNVGTQQVHAGELQVALRDGLGNQSALSNQPNLDCVAGRSQHGLGSRLSLRARPRPDGDRIHLFERPVPRIRYEYNAAALGLNAVQVALAGDGWADLVFVQNFVDANAVVPLFKKLSLRLIYRFEDARIRDWHYNGVSVNPMPANNGAYLDFGPQDYKVHLFGALFRYEL